MIILSLGIIAYFFVKKFPDMAIINIESIAQEKESKVRTRIMIERLDRGLGVFRKFLGKFSGPIFKKILDSVNQLYLKIFELEKSSFKNKPLKEIDVYKNIQEKISEANKLISDGSFDKAEEVCIDILGIDSKNLDAYKLLCDVYQEKKDYKKARETCRYLVKMLLKDKAESDGNGKRHRLANSYADLGWIYQTEGKNDQAFANFQKAVELEPNNPRFLDLLLKISIILENKKLAEKTFLDLKNADPDNQRLDDLKDQINNL